MSKRHVAALTGITLPLDVDVPNRDKICRATLAVTRHRLDDITIDVEPLEQEWPVDVEWAAAEAATRLRTHNGRRTWRKQPPRTLAVDLDPRNDDDFHLASTLAGHTWTTAISSDQSIALDTESYVHLWVTAAEYVDLVERVRGLGGDASLLVPDTELKPWYS